MANKAKRHTHKYYKAKLTYHTVWACALPDCTHHMPPHTSELLLGKATICWKCGETTFMDTRTMAMDKPLCMECDPASIPLDATEMTEETRQKLIDMGILDKME